MKDKLKLPYNPFENRNPEEVWKELLEKGKPLTKEEFQARLEEQLNRNEAKD